ncbi:MAG: hypothetical protein OEY29_09940 [Gammaproteobacteria bacterium]|nr:hypothetical protein [Gammaproteobacteria bacterium]
MKFSIVFFMLISLAFESAATEEEVSKLLLSEIMYYRLQDNNFDAIGRYMNAEEKNQLLLNKNNRAYIASVYLNYDLHSQVSSMLEYLIRNESAAVRDMSWYYLGKLHYESKRVKSAVKSFSKITGQLTATEQEMKYIMYGVMAMNDKQYDVAVSELLKASATSQLFPYVEYNLAVARFKISNNLTVFSNALTALALKYAGSSENDYIFADQIHTTLGYVLLQNKQYEPAKQSLRKVSLNAHLTTRALRGMIYASAELKQYDLALNLSLQLMKMTVGNESVHFSYIVIPYLLQKLSNKDKAVAFYQHAVDYFSQLRIDLKQTITRVNKGEFDAYLLDLEKILTAEEWLDNADMARLFRFVSTLDEWRDAVYKYREMKYLEQRLDESFYELVAIEPNVQKNYQIVYKESFRKIAGSKKQVAESIAWHQRFARGFITTVLDNQYDDVTDYLAQARFALAQFYDLEEQKRQTTETTWLRAADDKAAMKPAADKTDDRDRP